MKILKYLLRNNKKKELINKKVLNRIIKESNLCQHAIKELKLAGYGKGNDYLSDWIYQQIIETIAVLVYHSNSSSYVPFDIGLIKKLCSWDVISPLRFTNDEWNKICEDGTYQNKRKRNVFKDPDGSIHYIDAFIKRPTGRYSYSTKEWAKIENPIYLHGGLFEHKDNILTGRYFDKCILNYYDIINGWMPKETRQIDCVEVEIAPDNWIMAVNTNDTDLFILSCNYTIVWKECPCMKGVRLENVTPELEKQAYEEIKNNK